MTTPITYGTRDALLVSTKPAEVIDIKQPGGIDAATVYIFGNDDVVIEGCNTATGTFATVGTYSPTTAAPVVMRIPLNWPRFVRLKTAATNTSVEIRV